MTRSPTRWSGVTTSATCSRTRDTRKSRATRKGGLADDIQGLGELYIGKGTAGIECEIIYASYLAKVDLSERIAVAEGGVIYNGYL